MNSFKPFLIPYLLPIPFLHSYFSVTYKWLINLTVYSKPNQARFEVCKSPSIYQEDSRYRKNFNLARRIKKFEVPQINILAENRPKRIERKEEVPTQGPTTKRSKVYEQEPAYKGFVIYRDKL